MIDGRNAIPIVVRDARNAFDTSAEQETGNLAERSVFEGVDELRGAGDEHRELRDREVVFLAVSLQSLSRIHRRLPFLYLRWNDSSMPILVESLT